MKSELPIRNLKKMSVMLWRYFTLFAVIIVCIIAVVCYAVFGGAFSAQARKEVRLIGNELTFSITEFNDDDTKIAAAMTRYELSEGVDAFLLTPEGEVVIPKNYVEPDGWEKIKKDVVSRSEQIEPEKPVIYSTTGTLNYASSVIFHGGEHVLLVRYPLNIMAQTVHNMQLYVIATALIAILIAFLVSYTVAQKLSRPIKSVAFSANRLAKGDYNVQFDQLEYKEIAELSDTLNYVTGEIKKSDQFQKELLANVSHDFKTPLTMIKAYASMIREISGDDPEKRDKHLQIIIDESDRLTGLVNDVLAASKISAGLGNLNKKVFNLTEYLYGVLNKFDYLRETQGYEFLTDVDQNLYTLADEEKMGQVIYNLLSNAVNYTGKDKKVYISLKSMPEENRIRFSVRDTGKGISKEELEHIWDRYYRSNDAHTRPVKGTGLGLNIVKVILNSHAFDFGVNSKEGEGSTFFVDFPVVSSLPDKPAEEPAADDKN